MKIMNTIQQTIGTKLILGVLAAIGAFSATAKAQPAFVGNFTLPYEVRWNHAVLPAGEYSVRMDSKGAPAIIRSMSGNKLVYTATPMISDGEKGRTFLTVTMKGNDRRVRSLNLSSSGQSLIFDPLTKRETETVVKSDQIVAVPVLTAHR